MRVAVIGAGVIGVTTAYELASDGHAVTVFERRGSVGLECSYAHAGLLAASHVAPWPAPGLPGKVLGHLASRNAALRLAGWPAPATLGWLWRWWRACRPPVYRANRARMQRLAHYSRERLRDLRQQLLLDYEQAHGLLVLLRDERALAQAAAGLQALGDAGALPQVLDAAGCRAVEPGLGVAAPLHAGLYSQDDDVGNCRQFTQLLQRVATQRGVRFRFRAEASHIDAGAGEVRLLVQRTAEPGGLALGPATQLGSDWPQSEPETEAEATHAFDAVVVCAALGAPGLLRRLGVHLPIAAVHGHTLTLPLRDDEQSLHREPRASLLDERHAVAISRLGKRVRVSGGAELGGSPTRVREATFGMLAKVLEDWFPGVVRHSAAQRWKGARPMLPDGPPVLGPSGVPGVWLNAGHGGNGWALACGSARLLADAIVGRPTPIAIDGLGIERLGR